MAWVEGEGGTHMQTTHKFIFDEMDRVASYLEDGGGGDRLLDLERRRNGGGGG